MKRKSFYAVLICTICFIMSLGLSVPAIAASKADKPARPKIISVNLSAPKTITIRWNVERRFEGGEKSDLISEELPLRLRSQICDSRLLAA